MTICLTPEELEELSGYRRAREQCAWLDTQDIPYLLDRWQRPRVLRSKIDEHLSTTRHHGSDTVRGLRLDRVR